MSEPFIRHELIESDHLDWNHTLEFFIYITSTILKCCLSVKMKQIELRKNSIDQKQSE
jgi:hypothetical protein